MVSALLTILRKEPPTDREESIIDRALRVLDEHHDGVPVLGDLLRVIQDAPQEVRDVALDRGVDTRYKAITDNLEESLIRLTSGRPHGETFPHDPAAPMTRDRPGGYEVATKGAG